MADNIFQQVIGGASTLAQDVQGVQQAIAGADPLIARFKSIAAAAAASVLTDASLTTDEQRVAAATDRAWHSLRTVIGFGVDILRKTDANRLVTQYVASIIAADELAAGLQALALPTAPTTPASPTAPETPAQSTEAVTVSPHGVPPHEDASGMALPPHGPPPEPAPVSKPAAPQTFAQ